MSRPSATLQACWCTHEIRRPGDWSSSRGFPYRGVLPDSILAQPDEVAFDPEGRNLYLKNDFNGLVVFQRDFRTGRLSFLESFPRDLDDPEALITSTLRDLTVDPTGRFLYAVEGFQDSLVVFLRDPVVGKLTLAERHRNGEGGVDGLLNPRALAVSPSGQSVYVSTEVGGILEFAKGPGPCAAATDSLCLNASRYELTVQWRTRNGRTGSGKAVPGGTDDSGLVWFFGQDNWEVLAKVLDGCAVNGHFWVFTAATTNVEYTLTVRDTVTGAFKEYFNPFGSPAAAITDTQAFSGCSGGREQRMEASRSSSAGEALSSKSAQDTGLSKAQQQDCLTGGPGLCLDEDRFRVTVDWRRRNGEQGAGQAVSLQSEDSGLFWFFNERNWEMLVKVLDGCAVNGSYWVFSAATTNVEYTLTVTDTATGMEATYFNPLGTSAAAVTDTRGLPVCP